LKLFIKYMVSNRCKSVVRDQLNKLGLHFILINLGEVDIRENITDEQRHQLRTGLLNYGLELMDDQKAILIEKIKNTILELVLIAEEIPRINFSDYISKKLNHEYTYLANLFSEVTGTTIEHYIIIHKIERVKELLIDDELSITEISYRLNYSSVAHLSSQFKKVTGLTPTFFRNLRVRKSNMLSNV